MTMSKPRSGERGFWRCPVSVAIAAGPDEVVSFADSRPQTEVVVHRGRMTRIVQLDRDSRGRSRGRSSSRSRRTRWCPRRSDTPGRARCRLVGTNLALLRVRALTVPVVSPFAVLVKVPQMVAIVVSPCLWSRPSRPRHWLCDRRRSARTRRAETQWKAAGDGFFVSRCEAEGGGKKLETDFTEDDRGEAALRSGPIHSRAWPCTPMKEGRALAACHPIRPTDGA